MVYRLIAGEHLLIDLHSKARVPYYLITPTAAVIWERLLEWTTVEELAAEIVDRFDVEVEQAAADVRDFLGQLESLGGLIEEFPAA
jgi:hypothetical protein